jgi:1-phosphatidylinositol phosphodiesterase
MLNNGIRVFDMRFAYNPGSDTVGFYHGNCLSYLIIIIIII